MGEHIKKLEAEVDEILELYDFGEKLHSYDSVHGGYKVNENERRQSLVAFNHTNGQSGYIMQGSMIWGLAALYLYSRKGAKNLIDLSRLRLCGWTSASVFMCGNTLGQMINM